MLLTTYYVLEIHRLLLRVSLLTTYYILLTTYYLLEIHRLLPRVSSTYYLLLTTYYLLLATYCLLLTTCHLPLTTYYLLLPGLGGLLLTLLPIKGQSSVLFAGHLSSSDKKYYHFFLDVHSADGEPKTIPMLLAQARAVATTITTTTRSKLPLL